MKFEYGIIAVLGFLIFSVIGLIAIQPNQIPHWSYLQEIEQQPFEDGCNIDCMVQQEKRGHLCTEIITDEYVCRPPREIKYPDEEFQILTAFPPTYGEFAYFPAGVDMEERFFDITRVDLKNPVTNEIRVKFVQHNLEHFIKDFEYTTSLYPGHTFVSHCLGGDSKTAHLVEFRDVFVIDRKIYIEFWGSHVTMPDELLPCKMPELIQYTIPIDYSLGIEFVQ